MTSTLPVHGLDFAAYYQRRTQWSAMLLFAYLGVNFLAAVTYRSALLDLPSPAPPAIWLLEWGVIVPACAALTLLRWRSQATGLIRAGTLACVAIIGLAMLVERYVWVHTGAYFFSVLNCYFLVGAMVMSGIEYRYMCAVAFPILLLEIALSYALYGWGPAANFEALSFLTAGFVVFISGWQVERGMRYAWDEGRYFERLAYRDPLTGLLNRRAFKTDARALLEQAVASRGSIALAVLDLDRFKPFNDAYGHPAGDRALMVFARVLSGFAREGDLAARIGGEEFVLLWFGLGEDEVRARAESLVQRIREIQLPAELGKECRLSASLGAYHVQARAGVRLSALMREADRNLYRAKQAGGNRAVATHEAAPAGT